MASGRRHHRHRALTPRRLGRDTSAGRERRRLPVLPRAAGPVHPAGLGYPVGIRTVAVTPGRQERRGARRHRADPTTSGTLQQLEVTGATGRGRPAGPGRWTQTPPRRRLRNRSRRRGGMCHPRLLSGTGPRPRPARERRRRIIDTLREGSPEALAPPDTYDPREVAAAMLRIGIALVEVPADAIVNRWLGRSFAATPPGRCGGAADDGDPDRRRGLPLEGSTRSPLQLDAAGCITPSPASPSPERSTAAVKPAPAARFGRGFPTITQARRLPHSPVSSVAIQPAPGPHCPHTCCLGLVVTARSFGGSRQHGRTPDSGAAGNASPRWP